MPRRCCAVFNCKNVSSVTKAMGKTVVFHSFPRGNDSVTAARQKEWIRCCNRTKKLNPNHIQICSEHFTANDYERDLRNELLGLPPRIRLKKTAVPTVNLSLGVAKNHPENIQNSQRLTRRREGKEAQVVENRPQYIQRLTRRKRRREVQDISNNRSPQPQSDKKPKRHKDPPQIELVMCDSLPHAAVENETQVRLTRNQRQRKVQDVFSNTLQHVPTNLESRKGPPQIELIMCDDLPPEAVVENQHPDVQILVERQRQLGDQDILNNSLQSRSEHSPQRESIMYDEKLSMESNYKELLQKYIKLEEQYKLLESSSRGQIESLSHQVRYYENKCAELNSREKTKYILLERKSNRKSDSQFFDEKEKEVQILHLINGEDVCYISD